MAEKPHAKEHILEDREIEKIKENIETNEEKLIFNGLIYTGMRITEFLNLRRSWINWDKKRIRVPKKDDNPPFSVKTENSARVIPIVPELEPILKKFFDHYRVVKNFIPHRQKAWELIKILGERTGIKLFPHAVRATFATILARKDYNAPAIQAVMGWSKLETANKYIRLSGRMVEKEFAEKW